MAKALSHDPKSPHYVVMKAGWARDGTGMPKDREEMRFAKDSLDIFAFAVEGLIKSRYTAVRPVLRLEADAKPDEIGNDFVNQVATQYADKFFIRRGGELNGSYYEGFVAVTFANAADAATAQAFADHILG